MQSPGFGSARYRALREQRARRLAVWYVLQPKYLNRSSSYFDEQEGLAIQGWMQDQNKAAIPTVLPRYGQGASIAQVQSRESDCRQETAESSTTVYFASPEQKKQHYPVPIAEKRVPPRHSSETATSVGKREQKRFPG